jgi:hypothetical protein
VKRTTPSHSARPLARSSLIIAALVIIGVGAYNAYRGITKAFMDELRVGGSARRLVESLGVVGHVGRGVVFALVGVLPHEGRGRV